MITPLAKYRKRPLVVEAVQLSEDNFREISRLVGNPARTTRSRSGKVALIITTLEGDMLAIPGDYIIRGIRGEFYPCRQDIFEETYERLEDCRDSRV